MRPRVVEAARVGGAGWKPALDEALAASGLVVVAIDSHSSSQAAHPAAQADINYAIRWLKVHAADFHATPEGLALVAIADNAEERVDAVVRADHAMVLSTESAFRTSSVRFAARWESSAAWRHT